MTVEVRLFVRCREKINGDCLALHLLVGTPHPWLAEILALDGSQEVVVHTYKCSLFIGQYLAAQANLT